MGYAWQDRRASGREAVGARLVAGLLESGGLLERVAALDAHTEATEGFFGIAFLGEGFTRAVE